MASLKILVADDESGIRTLIQDALSRHGHDIVTAENGAEALSTLKNNPVDMVFLDINMPHVDGIKTLREIREKWPTLPVIMMTGCGCRDTIDEALSMGSFACLVKPFSIRDIVGMLQVLGQ